MALTACLMTRPSTREVEEVEEGGVVGEGLLLVHAQDQGQGQEVVLECRLG